MKTKIVVEVMREESYWEDKARCIVVQNLENRNQYLFVIGEIDLSDIQVGDIVRLWGEFDDITHFRAEKLELMTRYPKKVRNVLDI
jgi:hypothetical protein